MILFPVRERDRQRQGERKRQTDRQTDGRTDARTDRQKDRHSEGRGGMGEVAQQTRMNWCRVPLVLSVAEK